LLSAVSHGLERADFHNVKRHLLHALLLTVCIQPLQCATLERLSLDDMIAKSTAIVRGKVSSAFAAVSGSAIFTHYTVQVSERLKGTAGVSVEVLVPGGAVNGLRWDVAGAPALKAGDEYVLFLYTNRAGQTFVMGATQGLFSVAGDGSPDPVATRAATRELMLDRSSGRPVKDQVLVMRLSELRSRIAGKAVAR
jgi:hypothetical protein